MTRVRLRMVLGLVGIVLVVASLMAQSTLTSGSQSSATETRVCLGADYSLSNGCRTATHQLTAPEFGRAYVVTDVGERAGVDQYELFYVRSDGTQEHVATRQTTTGKVPRYVLSLADLSSQAPGPARPGSYALVTSSGGQQSSYALTVVDEAGRTSTTTSSATSSSGASTSLSTRSTGG